jgi:hypothetical protein
MEYELSAQERRFITELKSAAIQARAAVRDAQLTLQKAESTELQVQTTFDGALKLLLNANGLASASLSADCGKLVGQ